MSYIVGRKLLVIEVPQNKTSVYVEQKAPAFFHCENSGGKYVRYPKYFADQDDFGK